MGIPSRAALVAVGLLVTFGPTLTSAAPVVSVKARTAIELEPIRRAAGGITVRGRVVDRFTRTPIPWMLVNVRLDDLVHEAQADGNGRFETGFNAVGGAHDVEIDYAGDRHYSPASYEIRAFDVGKNPLTLGVDAERTVDLGAGPLEITMTAESDAGGVALRAELFAGDAEADALDLVGAVDTDNSGRGAFMLDQAQMGTPGRKRIEARYSGSPDYDAARAHTTFLLVTSSSVGFTLDDASIKYEARLRGKGELVDAAAAGLGGGAVNLVVGEREVAETVTATDGSFSFNVRASELGAGKHNVQVVFSPTRAWHRSSHSEPVTVTVAEPQPVPVSYTLAAFAATALVLIAFVGLRTQPWKRWKWLALWRSDDETAESGNDDAPPRASAIHTGLQPARPSLVSTLRRAQDHGFTGVVRNAINGRSIAGATVAINHDSHGLELADTGAGANAGGFALSELAPGMWHASVSADGFVTEQFTVSIPHRGELRGVRIDLLPVRERIFAMYGDIAKPLLPDAELWCIWTPRQVFDHVRGLIFGQSVERRPAALAELTEFVEETYFSPRTPTESTLEHAGELISAARVETAQTLVDPEPSDIEHN